MSGLLETIEATAGIGVHAVLPVRKECPIKREADFGTVEIDWTTTNVSLELHALRTYIESYEGQPLTHEDFTLKVKTDLYGEGVDDVKVSATWRMEAMQVTVFS